MAKKGMMISERFDSLKKPTKMQERTTQSVGGQLTSFSGIFNISQLSSHEGDYLRNLLKEFATNSEFSEHDWTALVNLTSEVKAINNQAAILHGERIKKAHSILARYRDGAFSAWLMAAYGNRQTPYNFLQYYEFYSPLSKDLQSKLDTMPRQAVYSLASRQGDFQLKKDLVESYQGETKAELLEKIREVFPLQTSDKRSRSTGDSLIANLAKINATAQRKRLALTKSQKETITGLIKELQRCIHEAGNL